MTPDSRLNHIRSTLDAALEVVEELFDGNLKPHDAVKLEMAEKFIGTAVKYIASMSIYSPVVGVEPVECGQYCATGSLCTQPKGHDAPHRSEYGFKWTDEEDARARNAIAKSMGGITNG